MKRVLLVSTLLVLLASPGMVSGMSTGFWAIDWAQVQTIHFTLAGTAINSAGVAPAVGRLRTDPNGPDIELSSRVFCVDLLHFASDNFANQYGVDVHTAADGNAGWTTPAGDGDALRAEDGLVRSAALANTFGWGWLDSGNDFQRYDKRVALNVAIWKAAYGNRFNYTSGMNLQQLGYYQQLIGFYNEGHTGTVYRWFDSARGDLPSVRQDFLEAEVPEPSIVVLLATLLIGSALVAGKRKKHSS